MKYTIKIDKEIEEEILICVRKRTKLIDDIENLILNESVELTGYKEREAILLTPAEIICFIVEENKVYALTDNDRFQLKQRLYQLEEMLDDSFVKINQSCIANTKKIARFDASFAGALSVVFCNGYKDYVSRRNVKKIKERFGVKL